MKYTWAIADIHGENDKLIHLLNQMEAHGFDLNDPEQMLIQLGDRNDRGPDSYSVNEYFKKLQTKYPNQVVVLLGNHDRMILDAADNRSDLMWFNGGKKTEESYSHVTKIYGKKSFGNSVKQSGHYTWLRGLPLFYETDEYFFSHAPVPMEQYRECLIGMDFRQSEQVLTWSFGNGRPTREWVEPNLIPIAEDGNFQGKHKIAVCGHIHSGRNIRVGDEYVATTENPIRIGNTILLDTGSGCWKDADLTALRLPDMLIVTEKGISYDLNHKMKTLEEAEQKRMAKLKEHQTMAISSFDKKDNDF